MRIDNLDKSTRRLDSWGTAKVLLWLIIVFGAVVRLASLDAQPLWLDEVASTYNAEAFGMAGMTGLAAIDHVAPLHSIILWVMEEVFGRSEYWLRLPSAIAGIICIPLIYVICDRLRFGQTVALLAAGLMAISPLGIWYSQEARMYAVLLLCSCAYAALCAPILHRSLSRTEWLGLFAVTVTGLYTHHYMALQMVAFGVALAFTLGPFARRAWAWLACQAAASLAFGYWLFLTADKLQANSGFAKPIALLWAPYSIFNFAYGFSLGPSVRELRLDAPTAALVQHGAEIVFGLLAATVVLCIGMVRLYKGQDRRAFVALLCWAIIPVALAIGATFVSNIAFNTRYVVTSLPPILILFAAGVANVIEDIVSAHRGRATQVVQPQKFYQIGQRAVVIAFLFFVVFSNVNSLLASNYAKEDARAAAETLRKRDLSSLTIADNSRVLMVMRYYGADIPVGTPAVDNLAWARTADTVLNETKNILSHSSFRELWLIEYRSWETDPQAKLRSWLDRTYTRATTMNFIGLTLIRYKL